MSQATISKIIKTDNPFSEFTVRTQDIWNEGFSDEPSLNAYASDLVFKAIDDLQNNNRKVIGITLRAEKGLGKSHIISRVRHRVQEMGNAVFIYMGDYGNLNDVRTEFLKTLAISLKYTGSKQVTQWQELATDLLNDVYQKQYHPNQIIRAIPQQLAKNLNYIGDLTDEICLKKPEISDPSLVQAILWTLSPVHMSYAVTWLSGKNISQSKSDLLSLPNSNQADRSSESFDIACEILSLISQYKSIIICFDQLEGTSVNDAGFTKAQVAANLGMDLYNNLSRGILLTAVYPDIWSHHIRALPTAEAVIDRIGECIVDLKSLNADDVILLVKNRLSAFYQKHQIKPPHDLYPFDEATLREKGRQKATARDILQWCCKNWKESNSIEIIDPIDLKELDLVDIAYQKELKELKEDDFIDDKTKLSKAIGFGFENLIGQTLEGVEITEVDYNVVPKSANKNYIDFRVLGICKQNNVKIGVAIIQYSTGIGVQAGLSRLIDYKKFDLTRGCLLRSKDISMGAKKAHALKDELINNLGGEWPPMKVEDLIPLLAIQAVFEAKEDYDLTEEEIKRFILDTKLASGNSLLLDILSDPSGIIPDNLTNDDLEITDSATNQDRLFDQTVDDVEFGDVA